MLANIFQLLDKWAAYENKDTFDQGIPPLPVTEILIIGQTALLEAKLDFPITATMDVDCYKEITYKIKKKFEELLKKNGKHLDPVGHEAWMPEESKFKTIYDGKVIKGKIAEPVYVILSKAKKAPEKNKNLIAEYLASDQCDKSIFELAEKYQIDLENLLL